MSSKSYIPQTLKVDLGDNPLAVALEKSTVDISVVDGQVRVSPITFGDGDSKIGKSANASLDAVVAFLAGSPDAVIAIKGHTDAQGDAEANATLSTDRAQAVLDYLVTKGVGPSRLSASGFGGTQPIADNDTEDGRLANNRIEFVTTLK